jgi:hypothetical protein
MIFLLPADKLQVEVMKKAHIIATDKYISCVHLYNLSPAAWKSVVLMEHSASL